MKLYKHALAFMPGVGAINAKLLAEAFSDLNELFSLSFNELVALGIHKNMAGKLSDDKVRRNAIAKAKTEAEFLKRNDIQAIFYDDLTYPTLLKDCYDSPYLFYQKGKAMPKNRIAIVGARKATNYGKDFTEALVNHLKNFDCSIVSGLAYGIDIAAHRSALKNDMITEAVLGHGFTTIYPALHRKEAAQIISKQGNLITEYSSDTTTKPANFPKRNRIVAGMSDAVVIVEAAEKGGALVTASIANSYNKEIFAVPGRIHDKFSAGCNQLIRTQRAVMIQEVEQITEELTWQSSKSDVRANRGTKIVNNALTEIQKTIVNEISKQENCLSSSLSNALDMDNAVLSCELLQLELLGLLETKPGGFLKIKNCS